MSSREEKPGRTETGDESRHSDEARPSDAAGPLFDPLLDPLPSELAGEPGLTSSPRPRPKRRMEPPPASRTKSVSKRRERTRPEPVKQAIPAEELQDDPLVEDPAPETELIARRPRPSPQPGARRATQARRPVRTRGPLRRVKRTITHVNPMSVLKLSLFYYVIILLVWLVVTAILYNLIAATGVFDAIQSIAEVFGDEQVDITFGVVMKWSFLIGLLMVVIGSITNAALAVLYNVGSDLVGGIDVTFSEEDR